LKTSAARALPVKACGFCATFSGQLEANDIGLSASIEDI
jgi:hypothetical protein